MGTAPTVTGKRWAIGAAQVSLIAGIALSHVIGGGAIVERTTLAGDTPAIRLRSSGPGPHPVALLAHGVTASKETLFRLGEALAAAGFDCYAIDLPGHGDSPRPFSMSAVVRKPAEIAAALGSVDVFLGHSMGCGAGAWSVREGRLRPKLFIGMGADAELGENGPPLLLLAGAFEEFIRPSRLKARTDARVIISPWCDHALEPYDPRLVNAAVNAACAAVGKTPPATSTAWLWRLLGLVLGIAGTLGLAAWLPGLHTRLARVRGFLVPLIVITAFVLVANTWVGAVPKVRKLPVQLGLAILFWFALIGFTKLRFPRWSLPGSAALLTLACAVLRPVLPYSGLALTLMAESTLLLCAATILGWIAGRHGSPKEGNLAVALFASYAIGQCVPAFY